MDFFNQNDFDLFSAVRGKKYRKDIVEDREIGDKIKSTIVDKTRFWANLIGEKGYDIHMTDRWQSSGNFIPYTWAKITLPGIANTKVFFTVGVGNRLDNDGLRVLMLDYKLDCMRANKDALDPSMVYLFDKYMVENCPEATLVQHELSQVKDWPELTTLVLNFIRIYQEHYLRVAEITKTNAANLLKKIVRLCWNSKQYHRPSGAQGKSQTQGTSFEKNKGYGYEEWLFNPIHEIGGYRYGFIQAFHKGEHKGKTYEISAYAIHNQKHINTYYWIGKFSALEILSRAEQHWVIEEFTRRGWKARMRSELQEIGVDDFDYEPIADQHIINVRYKIDQGSFIQYNPPILIAEPKQEIGKNTHYVSLPKQSPSQLDELPLGKFTFRAGHTTINTNPSTAKHKHIDYLMQFKHKQIQENIFAQLSEEAIGTTRQFGTENKTTFGKSIDLVEYCPINGHTFYELKCCHSALQCIREAIGQLLEYALYVSSDHAKRYIIIGLQRPSKNVVNYLKHLRKTLSISVYYQFYDETIGKLSQEVH